MKAVHSRHEAGRFKHRISIDRLIRTSDPQTGQFIENWASVGTFPAYIDKITGTEYFDGYLVVDRDNYYVEIRHAINFDTKDRLSFTDSFGVIIQLDIFMIADDREQKRFIAILGLVRNATAGSVGTLLHPPKVISSQILDTNKSQIKVVFDVPIQINSTASKMFNIGRNATPTEHETTATLEPTNNAILYINLNSDAHNNDVITWALVNGDYISSLSADTPLDVHTHGVTNLIPGHHPTPDPVPTVLSSIISNTDPAIINVTFDIDMQHTANLQSAIDVTVGTMHKTPLSAIIQADKRTLKITLRDPIVYHQSVTWAYNDQHPTETLESIANVEAVNQTYTIVNNVLEVHAPATAGIIQTADIHIAAPNQILVIFNTPMEGSPQKIINDTTIQINGLSVTPDSMNNNDSYLRYIFANNFSSADVVTLKISNLGTPTGQLQTVNGGMAFYTDYMSVLNHIIAPITAYTFEDHFDINTLPSYKTDGGGSAVYEQRHIRIETPASFAGMEKAIGKDLSDFTFEATFEVDNIATAQIIIYMKKNDTDFFMIKIGTATEVEIRGSSTGKVPHSIGLVTGRNAIKISGNNDHITISINRGVPETVSIASIGSNYVFKLFKIYMLHFIGSLDDIQISDHA